MIEVVWLKCVRMCWVQIPNWKEQGSSGHRLNDRGSTPDRGRVHTGSEKL